MPALPLPSDFLSAEWPLDDFGPVCDTAADDDDEDVEDDNDEVCAFEFVEAMPEECGDMQMNDATDVFIFQFHQRSSPEFTRPDHLH